MHELKAHMRADIWLLLEQCTTFFFGLNGGSSNESRCWGGILGSCRYQVSRSICTKNDQVLGYSCVQRSDDVMTANTHFDLKFQWYSIACTMGINNLYDTIHSIKNYDNIRHINFRFIRGNSESTKIQRFSAYDIAIIYTLLQSSLHVWQWCPCMAQPTHALT